MEYSKLGSSDLSVSRVCLGTMTWGVQNTQEEADQQIEYALSQGINFIDTAELYPVPPSGEKYGETERMIGDWIARNPNRRKEFILASKISGSGVPFIRNGGNITGEAVTEAIDASLARLQTDYIDLFQLHWPNRTSPHFAKHLPNKITFSDVDKHTEINGMLEILQALNDAIKAGKIRHCGLSDDTTWGINQYIKLSEQHALPRMVSIQNEFNLLHTKDWPYLIENCVHEDIAYLPWSPLAGGVLSGKYINGARPEGSRWSFAQRNGLFRDTSDTEEAVKAYMDVAAKHKISSAELALAWTNQIDGVTSTIIGATSVEQLQQNINAFDIPFNEEMALDIKATLKRFPAPF